MRCKLCSLLITPLLHIVHMLNTLDAVKLRNKFTTLKLIFTRYKDYIENV